MRRIMTAALIAWMLGLIGCGTTPQPIAPPVTDAQLSEMRSAYTRTDPDARVGVVTAVLTSDNLASVGEVPIRDFSIGDIITFLDSNGQVLVLGKVESINHNGTLTVRYETPAQNSRAPLVGDVAVRAIH